MSFYNERGLAVHTASRHKVVANSKVDTERKHKRWSKEESYLFAAEEVRLTRGKVRFLNDPLVRAFPHRTIESIKGQRKKEEHKVLVRQLLAEPPLLEQSESQNEPVMRDGPPREGPEEVIRNEPDLAAETPSIREHLLNLRSGRTVESYNDAELNSLVDKALRGEDAIAQLDAYLRDVFKQYLPPRRRGKGRRAEVILSRRKKRKSEYAAMQALYRKNRSEAARRVLEDEPEQEDIPELEVFEEAWGPIFGAVSPETPKRVQPATVKTELWAPISTAEIVVQQRKVDGSPGLDGVPPRIVKRMPPTVLAKIFNIILLSEVAPQCFLENRTIFIPKSRDVADPLNFRPISIASHVGRLFHKILAARLLQSVTYEPSQRAFLQADGCAENIALLSAIIRKSRGRFKEVHMAVLDLQKAYDSVGHQAIIEAAREKGLPDSFLGYLEHSYSNSSTRLQVKGRQSDKVALTRGVRQGDPLSPALFNYVIDTLLSRLPPGIGFELGERTIRCMAFADDLILISSTKRGLQLLLNRAAEILGPQGLSFNVGKCRSVSVVPSGRDKKTKVITEPMFELAGQLLTPTGIEDTFKYLGVQFSPQGKMVKPQTAIMNLLEKVKRAPLKPQQRLFILRVYVIPKLYHQLVLGRTRMANLKEMDTKVRTAIREWLRLPHDTPVAFFHAEVAEGGLGIPSIRWTVPRLILERVGNLRKSPCPLFRELAEDESVKGDIAHAKLWARDGPHAMDSKCKIKGRFAVLLHASVDGRGLREASNVKAAHSWVSDGTRLMSGNEYIECTKLRINALPTKRRTGRGQNRDVMCRAGCKVPESLAHICQTCHRTHDVRVRRHDGVTELLAKTLEGKGWRVEREFLYRTAAGNQKPDIVAEKEGSLYVIEAHVCSDFQSLAQYRRQKMVAYNSNPLLWKAIATRWNHRAADIKFTTATISFRGVWEKESAQDLAEIGIRGSTQRLLSVRAIQGSLHAFRMFNRMTTQQ